MRQQQSVQPGVAAAHSQPGLKAAARFAVALGPLLLATAILSSCRQDPAPEPLPEPITDRPEQSLVVGSLHG